MEVTQKQTANVNDYKGQIIAGHAGAVGAVQLVQVTPPKLKLNS